jgi:hypothetical protein
VKPRCGAEMTPYEAVWGALLDPVVCGRPEGHPPAPNGSPGHRSVQAIRKERERARTNWPEYRRRRQEKRDKQRAQEQMRDRLIASVEAASKHARDMALRTRQVNW